MKFSIFQESRLGACKINQHRVGYCYSRDALLMVVADGMGGHLNGELAWQIAVQYLTELFRGEARTRLSGARTRLGERARTWATRRVSCITG